jgi:ABC-type branched-subunit amino acid transport system substrate-binding protein
MVLAEGVKQAGSFDASQVANAIRGLAEVQTPMGTISYGADGDLTDQKIYVFEVRDGDWVQVYPEGD